MNPNEAAKNLIADVIKLAKSKGYHATPTGPTGPYVTPTAEMMQEWGWTEAADNRFGNIILVADPDRGVHLKPAYQDKLSIPKQPDLESDDDKGFIASGGELRPAEVVVLERIEKAWETLKRA